ncbi:MAG: DUF3073 domain-containing protein [Candidatus Nanopelagicales bacterium]|nr:DUF3073 domain-containing protein [Candidatus Nanopelagicales bacterium]
MGRGRAKAKQTKVARALKYGGPQTDFDRLQAELAHGEVPERTVVAVEADDDEVETDELDDPYAKYYEADDEDDDER